MCFSFKLKSHVKEGETFENGQLLVDHLKGVRNIALATTKMHGVQGEIESIISIICMCHDFGKASSYFQKYLKSEYRGELKNHGEISAYFTSYMLPEKWKLIGFMCVKKHHGNMDPDINFFDINNADNLHEIGLSIEKHKEEMEAIYDKDLTEFFTLLKDKKFLRRPLKEFIKKSNKFTVEDCMWLQYLWSLLLTGDKTQLIRGAAYINKENLHEDYVNKYKNKIIDELLEKNPQIKSTKLFEVRNKVYDEVIDSINKIDLHKSHLLSINVPTGTGKTLAVYGGAFRLAERILKENQGQIIPSIIYNLPFTSVIDQNYEVLENILDMNGVEQYDSLILKHHSLSTLKYEDDENTEYKNYDARFCVENWQSTIITTTFAQLFNTIFQTGINGIGNRFHKFAGSIIILDEVQAIPPKYYKIIEEIFRVMCDNFNTYLITVTATKPLFLIGQELVKTNEEMFRTLDRIRIYNNIEKPINLEEFGQIVLEDISENEDKSFLVVLNTVKSSLKVLEKLTESNREVIYLSTEIFPARRLEIINTIKKSKDKKFVLVSTQLIEAGVDLDFDIVYRDFSTIDSINQTAGRANRNAIKGKGIVKLFMLKNVDHNDKQFCRYIYPISLLEASHKILRNRDSISETEIFDINNEYFKLVESLKSNDASNEISEHIRKFNFDGIRKSFKLIDDNYMKEDIIINFNDETEELIRQIKQEDLEYQQMINVWRKLNRYRIAVDKKDTKNLNTYEIKGVNILNKEHYDENRGVIRSLNAMC